MDDWVKNAMTTPLAGIEARWWVRFFKLFDERGDENTIRLNLNGWQHKLAEIQNGLTAL